MELNAHQISILLMVPSLKDAPIPLDLDMIHHPELKKSSGLSKLPYITQMVKYPTKLLQKLARDGYSSIVSFFFNKTQFETLLFRYAEVAEEANTNGSTGSNSLASIDSTLTENVMSMLMMLFPAYYPSSPNVSTSYSEYIKQEGNALSFKLRRNTSYVKIDGKPYTVSKTVFLNDLLNHPIYSNVIRQYIQYSAWAKRQEALIESEIKNGLAKLYARISDEKGDLNIFIYLNKLREMIDDSVLLQPQRVISKAEDDKRLFQETLKSLVKMMADLIVETESDNGVVSVRAKPIDSVDTFYENITNINELYKRLVDSKLMKKTPPEFAKRTARIIEETYKWINIKKIRDEYILPRNINVKLEDVNSDIVELLKSKYKPYIEFVELIKTIIKPVRESSNPDLQESIVLYSQNRSSTTQKRFSDIMQKAHDKYMRVIGKKQNTASMTDADFAKYMNVGVCGINADEQNKPHYEIYIAMNLIENEYTKDSIQSIKCIYDGFSLGKDLEDKLNNVNPYEANLHTLLVSQSDIESQRKSDANAEVQKVAPVIAATAAVPAVPSVPSAVPSVPSAVPSVPSAVPSVPSAVPSVSSAVPVAAEKNGGRKTRRSSKKRRTTRKRRNV